MKEAGISKIAFLRHGKTSPALDGVDFNRQLTAEGQLQADQAGLSFGRHDLPPYFPCVLVSPSPRTIETAEIFLKSAGVVDLVKLQRLPIAYDGTMQPGGHALFKKIGYAPLVNYIDNKDSDSDRKTAQRLLSQYAQNIADVIYEVANQNKCTNSAAKASTLLFVGHAIYLPAAALGIASIVRCDNVSQSLILSSVTREAEGYLVDLDKSSVRYLARPAKLLDQ